MPAARVSATTLGKLLHAVPQPVYILERDLTIIFVNQACREWLGDAADNLPGRRCVYASTPVADGPDALAASLCPPPAVLSGKPLSSTIVVADAAGTIGSRNVLFTPLCAAGRVVAIVALVDSWAMNASERSTIAATPEGDGAALHDAIRRFRQEATACYRADRLIGEGPAMRLARRQVELAAASRSSVLLVGPVGSGRQHLAAAIHYGASASSDSTPRGGLMRLDCALLGPDLLEAAGATLDGPGMASQPGTLLLHRVDELPGNVQVQLADVLARRVSAWRLIATAAEPLRAISRRGKFCDELAVLLSTITIELPPLCERREDLPLLAQLFLEDCNAAGQRQVGGFSVAAMDRLDAYGWPNNLDELAEVVAESHRRAAGPEIDVGDLPERLHVAAQAAAHPRRAEETIVLDEYLRHVERELIRRALGRAKGNKAKAARLLGVTRPRLYRRMILLGLE
ncbi:MAG: helix-turn-helix domain-containing protein [Thermoguttaceae bacterium]